MTRFVLMLEEDSDDRYITQEILHEVGVEMAIQFVSESTQLFDALEKNEKPSLILVDFNSAPENGLQVLRRLKESPQWRTIPVVILSERSSDVYRNQCYAEGASTFITKPLKSEQTKKKIETFFTYWLDVAEI